MDTRKRRYLLKLLGYQDPQPELQALKNTEKLNQIFDHTPIFYHRPSDDKKTDYETDQTVLVGMVMPNQTNRTNQPPDEKAIYATAEILAKQIKIFETFMDPPNGVDITAEPLDNPPYIQVISIDLVHNPRGSGRIVRVVE